MCEFFSCVITQKKVVWDDGSMSHKKLLAKAGITDNTLVNRKHVSVEILPKVAGRYTRDKKDLTLKCDEEATLPPWFVENRKKHEARAWAEFDKAKEKCLAIGTEKKETSGFMFAADNSAVTARNNSIVTAWDNSTVNLFHAKSVSASGNAIVIVEREGSEKCVKLSENAKMVLRWK